MARASLSRLSYIDLLKIFATFMIVLLHVSALYVNMDVKPLSNPHVGVYLINGLTRIALPLFMMMSGVLLLRDHYQFKFFSKFTFILNNYIIWSAIYMLSEQLARFIAGSQLLGPAEMIVTWIRGPYHFWYLLMLMGFYILMPLLSKLKDLQSLTYMLLLVFVINYLYHPFIGYFPETIQFVTSHLVILTPNNVLFYFLLGAWIYRLPRHQNIAMAAGVGLGLGLGLRIYQLYAAATLTQAINMPLFNDYSELFLVGAPLYLCKFFLNDYKSSINLQKLSNNTLRIFIISPLFIFSYDYLFQDAWDKIFPYQTVTVLILTVIIFILTAGVAALLSKKDHFFKAYREKRRRL